MSIAPVVLMTRAKGKAVATVPAGIGIVLTVLSVGTGTPKPPIAPARIASTSFVFSPAVAAAAASTVTPPRTESGGLVRTPTLLPGGVNIAPAPIASAASIGSPGVAVASVKVVAPDRIASSAALFQPSLAFTAPNTAVKNASGGYMRNASGGYVLSSIPADPLPSPTARNMTEWNVSVPIANPTYALTVEPADEAAIDALSDSIATPAQVHDYYQVFSDRVRFVVPFDATVTTSGSSYPRSEWRELLFNGSVWDDDEWRPDTAVHRLTVDMMVEALTMRADGNYAMTNIGQIHGANEEPCRLGYRPKAGGVTRAEIGYANDKWNDASYGNTGGIGSEGFAVLRLNGSGAPAEVDLGERFTYRIEVANNIQTVSAKIRGQLYSHSQTLHAGWANDPCYFKAGNYRQANTASASDNRRAVSGSTIVHVFGVEKYHSPDSTYFGF